MTNMMHFNGKNFKMWLENVATSIESLHPHTVRWNDGEKGPMGESMVTRDRANKNMHEVDFKGTLIKARGAAPIIAYKSKTNQTKHRGAGGQGKTGMERSSREVSF